MATRHEARERALGLLYSADLRGRRIQDLLGEARAGEDPPPVFAVELVAGVDRTRDELDALITAYARDWTLERMPVLDRNILRLGMYELHHTDVPPAVVIDEAVELAKSLSTDDSGRYVNGILARAATRLHADDDPRDWTPEPAGDPRS
jgi:transcription antitermination protein NusB